MTTEDRTRRLIHRYHAFADHVAALNLAAEWFREIQEASDGLRRLATEDQIKPRFSLGDRVKVVDAKDITGTLSAHTRYDDGSERWTVTYWLNGERKHIDCQVREIALHREEPEHFARQPQ